MNITGSFVANVGPAAEIVPLPGQDEKVTLHCVGPQPARVALLPSPKPGQAFTEAIVIPKQTLELKVGRNTHLSIRATPADCLSAHTKIVVCVGNGIHVGR